jgi:hypothetical protein
MQMKIVFFRMGLLNNLKSEKRTIPYLPGGGNCPRQAMARRREFPYITIYLA